MTDHIKTTRTPSHQPGKSAQSRQVPPRVPPTTDTEIHDIVLDMIFYTIVVLLVMLAIILFWYRQEISNTLYPENQKPGITLSPTKYWDPNLPRTKEKWINLQIDIENIYFGMSVQVSISKSIICPSCSGTGAKSPDHLHVCPTCGGRGYQDVVQRMGFIQLQSQQICPKCNGKGKSISEDCPVCHGKEIIYQDENITIPLEKGVPEGYQINVPYGSDEAPNHAPGDLHFYIKSTSKNIPYRRDNEHLHFHLTLSLLEALVGFKKSIPHIAGEVIIERDEVTIPDQIIVIPEKGMPIYRKEGKYGNLYVHILVQFPQELSPSEKEGVKKILGEEETHTEDK